MLEKKICKCTKCQKEKKIQNEIEKTPKVTKEEKEKEKTPNVTKLEKEKEKTPKKACKTVCHDSVDVKVDVIPEVLLKQIKNANFTTFEIELDVEANPKCRVVKKKVYDPVNCKAVTKYVLLVESDVKLDCSPKITQTAGKPYAKYEMDVIVEAEQHIKGKGKEKVKDETDLKI